MNNKNPPDISCLAGMDVPPPVSLVVCRIYIVFNQKECRDSEIPVIFRVQNIFCICVCVCVYFIHRLYFLSNDL